MLDRTHNACLLFGLFALLLFTTGCADLKTYIKDRGNDFADCFTARAGWENGLCARLQVTDYLAASVGASYSKGKTGYFGRTYVEISSSWQAGVPIPQILFVAYHFVLISGQGEVSLQASLTLLCTDLKVRDERPTNDRLHVLGFNVSPLVFADESWTVYWKQTEPLLRQKFFIEFGAALGVFGFDVGFNPVEFVDFFLGWFGVDITGDDANTEFAPEPESREEPAP